MVFVTVIQPRRIRRRAVWRAIGWPALIVLGSISYAAAMLALCWFCFAIFGE